MALFGKFHVIGVTLASTATPTTPTGAQAYRHWWFDIPTASFWPVTLQDDHEPASVLTHQADVAEDSAVLLGGQDGYVRRYRDAWETDEGNEIVSFVRYGPFRMGTTDYDEGRLLELIGEPATESGDVAWSVHAGANHEAAVDADAFTSGTWAAGTNYTVRPRLSGGSCMLQLSNGDAARAWAMEAVTLVMQGTAKQRKT